MRCHPAEVLSNLGKEAWQVHAKGVGASTNVENEGFRADHLADTLVVQGISRL